VGSLGCNPKPTLFSKGQFHTNVFVLLCCHEFKDDVLIMVCGLCVCVCVCVQLSDFGLAKWAPKSSLYIRCNDVVGTFG